MSRIWMPGGAGGADVDVVTAGAGDVLKGKVIVGPDGEPLTGTLALSGDVGDSMVLSGKTYYNTDPKQKRTGTMPNQGAKTAALNCGGSYTIPAGYHNGSGKVTANGLASQTGVQGGKTAAGAAQIQTGYEAWVNGGRVTGSMATMNGGTYTPSGSQQTISCSGKKMNSNIIISAIPSKYVDVTAAQTVFSNGVCRLVKRVYPYLITRFNTSSGTLWDKINITPQSNYNIFMRGGSYGSDGGNAYKWYLLLDGTVDLSKFSKINITVTVNLSNDDDGTIKRNGLIYLGIIKNKNSYFSINDVLNAQASSKTTVSFDISSFNEYGFIMVRGTSSAYVNGTIILNEIVLVP